MSNRWHTLATCCVVLTLALPVLPRTARGAPSLPDILKAHNVQPLQPPPQAPDFKLPTLDGSSLSLDKFRGHWALLTFFATWCGPCAAEMPSLQALYDSMHGHGLDILAVAVDPEDDVAGYVRKRGLRFPVVLDTHGQAASTYQASSIPITYIMDPTGKLVGVAQGARDWQAASTLIDALMREVPPSVDGRKAASQNTAPSAPAIPAPEPDKPVALPSHVVPPDAHAEVLEQTIKVGKPFHLNVTVQWAGTLRDYILLPPAVGLPEGVRNLGTSATTSTDTGRASIVYRVTLVSDVDGPLKLDPVEIRYQTAGQHEPMSRHIAGPTVDVKPFLALDKQYRVPVFVASVLVLMVAGMLAIGWSMRRALRRRRAAVSMPETNSLSILDSARRARINGDMGSFMACMVQLLPEPPELHREVASLAEAARYGGQAPDSTTLDRLLRAAERRVETLATAPQSRAEQSP